jgi:hypothetical protein
MKLKVMYDTNNMPSTAMLCISAEGLGFESLGPISEDCEVVGNVWQDPQNPDLENFDALKQHLLEMNSYLTFEVID